MALHMSNPDYLSNYNRLLDLVETRVPIKQAHANSSSFMLIRRNRKLFVQPDYWNRSMLGIEISKLNLPYLIKKRMECQTELNRITKENLTIVRRLSPNENLLHVETSTHQFTSTWYKGDFYLSRNTVKPPRCQDDMKLINSHLTRISNDLNPDVRRMHINVSRAQRTWSLGHKFKTYVSLFKVCFLSSRGDNLHHMDSRHFIVSGEQIFLTVKQPDSHLELMHAEDITEEVKSFNVVDYCLLHLQNSREAIDIP